MTTTRVFLAAALASLLLAGCGGQEAGGGSKATRSDRLVDFSKKPPYVNALDIDPASQEFLLTTNRGFWRIDPKTDAVKRVTGSISAGGKTANVGTFLDLVATGPGRLIGSGHPDRPGTLPSFLGFIESDDGGRRWKVISRLGEADLHKIELRHDRMYAFDAVLGAMLVSTDGGKTFTENFTPPELIIDFEVDPAGPDRILASSQRRIFRSTDGGKKWRPIQAGEGTRLAWPAPDALYRAEKDGTIEVSETAGDTFKPVGRVPGEPYKFKAVGPDHLYLALSDGAILETTNGGKTLEGRLPAVMRRRHLLLGACLALAACGALPGAAAAHSIVRVIGGELSYQSSDATSLNSLEAVVSGGDVRLRDPTVDGGIDPGPCRPGEVTNDANAWIIEAFCPSSSVQRLRIDLGEREDVATISLPLPVTLLGGPGADRLAGGDGADSVGGGDGDDSVAGGGGNDAVDGGSGIDSLDGGPGDDRLGARDGFGDHVTCGEGADQVVADSFDDVAGDCETVGRATVAPPTGGGGGDDGAPPKVEAGGSTRQRIGRRGRIRVLATSSEPGFAAASGFLDVAGLNLPLKSDRRRVAVGGAGVVLTVKLSRRQMKECRRVFKRRRRVVVRLRVVATDLAGHSSAVTAPRIRLRR